MAATAADLTIAYRFMAQPNPDDPDQNLLALSLPPDPSAKKYVGICRDWLSTASPEVLTIFNQTLTHLTTTLHYEPIDIKLPFLRQGQVAHAATCLTEAASDARNRASPSSSSYLRLLNYPNRILIGTGSQTPAIDYLRYGQIRQAVMSHLAFLYQTYPGLLILSPTTPIAGWPVHPGDEKYGCSDGNMSIANMAFAWLASTSGCPAVSFPAGYVEAGQGEGVLPVGVMAMGEWGCEEQLLAFAREREGFLNEVYPGGRRRPGEWVDIIGLAKGGKGKDGKGAV
jgi:Asp-tRNA(Asn)/Glu-tRNA(Gln) amidotransferase A subunit family amidase